MHIGSIFEKLSVHRRTSRIEKVKEGPFLEMLLSQVAFWAWEMQEIMKSLSTPWSVLAQDILCHQMLQGSTLLVKMLILKEKDGFKTEVLNAVLSVLFAFLSPS